MSVYMRFKEIEKELKKPLDYKIEKALCAIEEGFSVSKHNQAVAFSGGKDSTVLWHLIRENFKSEHPYIIYCNTGVEFPESLQFARKLGKEWGGERFCETKLSRTEKEGLKYQAQKEVLANLEREDRLSEVLKPDGKLKSTECLEKKATAEMMDDFRARGLVWPKGTLKSYWWCADQYGFPILGKAASLLNARRINIDCFLKYSESKSGREKVLKYYDVLKECKISQHCCKVLKKEPAELLQAELGVDVIFKGLMASESRTRRTNFATRGYLFQSTRPHCAPDPFYHCNPISIWTDDDVWKYIHDYDVPYAPLYDMGYTDWRGIEHKVKRNGCVGCATDIAYKDNHLAMLRQTHPKQWFALMKYGMKDELLHLHQTRKNGYQTVLDVVSSDEIMQDHQCAFDDLYQSIDVDGLRVDYDPEV